MKANILENDTVIANVNKFLAASDARYSDTMKRAVNDLKRYSGDFWDNDTVKKYNRKKRTNLTLNNWCPISNAISSPMSNSPWHIELTEDNYGQLQEALDEIENDNDSKHAILDSFRKAVLTGYGFLVMTTVEDEYTGEAKIIIESSSRLDGIALDPNINTVDGSDAEEGAIINYISVKKAKRLYGEDIVPFTYPATECTIAFSQFKQWNIPADSIAIISYFAKNDNGTVDYYKICGNKVIESYSLPIKYIPIIRIAGNEIIEDDEINYNGIIQQTLSLETGVNIAYSTLIERCGRSPKANYMVNIDAIDGLERNMAAVNQDDTVAVLWKGEHQPVPLSESFQTGDLQACISTCRTLMEDTLGIPLSGLVERERTATEVLRQELSKESNTAVYYNNAYKAIRTLGKCIIEMLNEGNDVRFSLENGPAIITRQIKQRQELTALATIMPDNMKPIIAKYFADTLKNDLGDELSRNIVANLPNEIRIISEAEDPNAIHILNQMNEQLQLSQEQMAAMAKENEDLKTQLKSLQLNALNNQAQREQDWQKFIISEQDKIMLEQQKQQIDAEDKAEKNILKQQEVNIKEAETEMAIAEHEITKELEQHQAYIEGVKDAVVGG